MSPTSSKMAAALLTLTLILHFVPASLSTTESLLIDDLAGRRTITIHIGDSILFTCSHLQNAYLFRNRKAFDLCNFEDAYLIFHGRSIQFKWTPAPLPSPSEYYFATKNESALSCKKGGNVLLVRVIIPQLSPASSPENAPPPTAGGDLPSSPSRGWGSSAGSTPPPSVAPEASPREPSEGDSSSPPALEDRGEGIPFINSNPAVPLPTSTGETDTAALRPLPAAEGAPKIVGVGLGASLHIQTLHVTITVIMLWVLCVNSGVIIKVR